MTILGRFEIHQPASAQEASQMLTHFGEEAGIYAGGTELRPSLRFLSVVHPEQRALQGRTAPPREIPKLAGKRVVDGRHLVRERLNFLKK